jgi:hypothetical protein
VRWPPSEGGFASDGLGSLSGGSGERCGYSVDALARAVRPLPPGWALVQKGDDTTARRRDYFVWCVLFCVASYILIYRGGLPISPHTIAAAALDERGNDPRTGRAMVLSAHTELARVG